MGIIRNISQNNLVFVVDDNKVYRELIGAKIETLANVQVETFASAEEALADQDKQPKLILLDLYLDGENPNALSGHKAIEKFSDVENPPKIILISGELNYTLLKEYEMFRNLDHVLKSELPHGVLEQKVSNALLVEPVEVEE